MRTADNFDFSMVAPDNFRSKKPPAYLYILALGNDTFYSGITNNLETRIAEHKAGIGAVRPRRHGVKSVVAHWKCSSRLEARMWEDYLTLALRKKKPSEFSVEQIRELYREKVKHVRAELVADGLRQFFHQYGI